MVIKWSDFAKNNLRDFIETSKYEFPISYVQKLVANIQLLEQHPRAGKFLFYLNNIEVRQLLHEKHRIVYRTIDTEIQIGAVLHTSQDLDSSLKFLNKFFK